ncbi:hypothetical protein C4565_10375 [Candidatus Parcubacteria bacterium]|nr:MAG: hypothetical protein C4565_10375 [Candidatus Parcubacteria bacterium]
MSLGCGMLCSDLLTATYRSAPDGFSVACQMSADYESSGGENFAQQILCDLECESDYLRENEPRADIELEEPVLSAEY